MSKSKYVTPEELEKIILGMEGLDDQVLAGLRAVYMAMAKEGKLERSKIEHVAEFHRINRAEDAAFAKRGFKYGTPAESWLALRTLAECLEAGEEVPGDVASWFVEAVKRTEKEDPVQLTRELGFLAMGRRRVVNKYDIADRVEALVRSGSSIMGACAQAGGEFSCATTTAHHWYRTLKLSPTIEK